MSETTTVDALVALGLSQYEARAYVGLLRNGEQTGYALANSTSVPQPKVYETLRRLVRQGMAMQVGDKPAVFAAVPADDVLGRLEDVFQERLDVTRAEMGRLDAAVDGDAVTPVWRLRSEHGVLDEAERLIGRAERKIYISGSSLELGALASSVSAAEERAVDIVLVHFGEQPFESSGAVFRHASTDGFVYPHHQARHLGVVVDSAAALWATAPDGRQWEGVSANDALIASVVKLYIRHDIFVQRIYADLPDELRTVYGPTLERLGDFSAAAATAGKVEAEPQLARGRASRSRAS